MVDYAEKSPPLPNRFFSATFCKDSTVFDILFLVPLLTPIPLCIRVATFAPHWINHWQGEISH